jgi:hypothetical protein
MKDITAAIILICLLSVGVSWADEGYIGSIKTLEGTVDVIRQGGAVYPLAGTRLKQVTTARWVSYCGMIPFFLSALTAHSK